MSKGYHHFNHRGQHKSFFCVGMTQEEIRRKENDMIMEINKAYYEKQMALRAKSDDETIAPIINLGGLKIQ